jgi:hypothetical protein
MQSSLRIDTPLRIAAVLALVLLLIDFSARAALDQHEFGAPAGHSLCAICVYTGGSAGLPESDWVPALPPQRHEAPSAALASHAPASARFGVRIRAPPASS